MLLAFILINYEIWKINSLQIFSDTQLSYKLLHVCLLNRPAVI